VSRTARQRLSDISGAGVVGRCSWACQARAAGPDILAVASAESATGGGMLATLAYQGRTGFDQARQGTARVAADGLEPADRHAKHALLLIRDDDRLSRAERYAEDPLRLLLIIRHG